MKKVFSFVWDYLSLVGFAALILGLFPLFLFPAIEVFSGTKVINELGTLLGMFLFLVYFGFYVLVVIPFVGRFKMGKKFIDLMANRHEVEEKKDADGNKREV